MRRIPSLDGLRAISILMVLYGHLDGTRGFGTPPAPFGELAHLGVRVFFVISGFLITTLLLDEISTSGHVDVKSFYVRRVFRIFPAFYAFLAVVVAARALGWTDVSARDLSLAATYTINFTPDRAWIVGHLWSLSVEEQFYLLWPATLHLLGVRRALVAAAGVMAAAPLVRIAWFYLLPGHVKLVGEAFPTVADSIAAGCVLAGLRSWLEAQPWYARALRSPAVWLLPLLALAINRYAVHVRPYWLVGETVTNVCIAVVIHRVITLPHTWSGKLLNARPVAFVGVLSYSLYLWQQPFLNRASASPWCGFPQNLALAFALALASHYLVEKPFLRLRAKMTGTRPKAPALPEPEPVVLRPTGSDR